MVFKVNLVIRILLYLCSILNFLLLSFKYLFIFIRLLCVNFVLIRLGIVFFFFIRKEGIERDIFVIDGIL